MSYSHALALLRRCDADHACPRPGLVVDDTDPSRRVCARHALTAAQENTAHA